MPAEARVYTCTGENGEVSFSQTPCAVDLPATGYGADGRSQTSLDCRLAGEFLYKHAEDMQRGKDASSTFAAYGGVERLSPSAASILNYVYTFENNRRESAERITKLGTERCESGSFGRVDCSVFPSSFINRLGGCEGAMNNARTPAAALPVGTQFDGNTDPWLQAPAPGSVAGQPARQRSAHNNALECKTALTEEISSLYDRLRDTLSIGEIERLHDQVRALKSERYACEN